MYTQLAFVLDLRAGAAAPEWKTTQPFKAVLDGDMKALAGSGEKGLLQLVMATHSGTSTADFETRGKKPGWPVRSTRGSSGPIPN